MGNEGGGDPGLEPQCLLCSCGHDWFPELKSISFSTLGNGGSESVRQAGRGPSATPRRCLLFSQLQISSVQELLFLPSLPNVVQKPGQSTHPRSGRQTGSILSARSGPVWWLSGRLC